MSVIYSKGIQDDKFPSEVTNIAALKMMNSLEDNEQFQR